MRYWLAVLSFLAVTTTPPAAPGPSQPAEDLKILSFNIRYGTADDGPNRWELRQELVLEVLRREQPDLVGLQEALRFQIDAIRDGFPEYSESGVGRDDGMTAGEYSAVLYRKDRLELLDEGTFWFSEETGRPGSIAWGARIPRICSWVLLKDRRIGRQFRYYNLHLDHQSQESRWKSVQILAEKIRSSPSETPVVISGDFNAGEDNPAIGFLTGRIPGDRKRLSPGFVDTFRALHPNARAVGTFNGFDGDDQGARIDYILVSPGIEVKDASIVKWNREGRYPSDHFPVSARIRLP